jgi:hypothetical protein
MNELDTALFCEKHNRMNDEDKRRRERECAYTILQNMSNMLQEYRRDNKDLPIPWREKPSVKIRDRYGIEYESDFRDIWVILERLCNGEYSLKE